ncbi:MAG: hypothetical protein GAK28_00868 [Luteibacter sp.]|uniref:RICIN domain-containing protein n=1 Tax=Luteibacter sp. TaxID=1886636 RepID=UPI001381BB1C|nr:RICIN domain-containing protein [Luteibacter sp.]KAF1008447.1 MAG: hypothetical protein GAK28_00868 [Luteibacter sp.]
MKKTLLSIALGMLIAPFGATAVATDIPATHRPSVGTSDIRFVHLSELPELLSGQAKSTQENSSSSTTNQRSSKTSSAGPDPLIAWMPSTALSSEEARIAAAELVRSGVGILVSVTHGAPRYDTKTFGIEAAGQTVLYQQLADGKLDVYSSDAGPNSQPEDWLAMVTHTRRAMADAAAHVASTASSDDLLPGPYKEYSLSAGGTADKPSFVKLLVRIDRDSGLNRDNKIITVQTQSQAKPYRNGVSDCGFPHDSGECAFRSNGEGVILQAPSSYRLKTMLTWPTLQDPGVVKIDHYPTATAQTDVNLTHTSTYTTSFDWGISRETAGELGNVSGPGGLTDALGKGTASVGFNIGGGWTKTKRDSVKMTVKDYSIQTHEQKVSLPIGQIGAIHETRFTITPQVVHHDYFWKSDGRVSTQRMTPMMSSASLESLTRWKVRGDYEGGITLSATTDIHDLVWGGANSKQGPVYVHDRPLSKNGGNAPGDDPYFPDHYQAIVTLKIDLSSPYLTRSPTVMIQSRAEDNTCLTAVNAAVTATRCNKSEGNRAQQWNIDALGRYVNRSNGKCLTPVNGAMVTSDCSMQLSQRWEWRHDRIHSIQEDGMKRLTLSKGAVQLSSYLDGIYLDPLPTNPVHAALMPWSSYPAKPKVGDMVPGFGRSVPLPQRYLDFRAVSAEERWNTIPFVAGLQ